MRDLPQARRQMRRAGWRGVKQHRSDPRPLVDAYYPLGRLSDRLFGLRPPMFEGVSFLSQDRVLDTRRAREELGYDPQFSVASAARRTVEWMRREEML